MRLTRDEWGLRVAEATALRGTCLRRAVGCVLVDAQGRVLSTGYNGVARGARHCNGKIYVPAYTGAPPGVVMPEWPDACPGAKSPSGSNLGECRAVHAECNACLWCPDVMRVHTCYSTTEPCIDCTKMLLNTGCQRVVFRQRYKHPSEDLWNSVGRGEWVWLRK